eukprot:gene3574-13652_t
MFRQLPRLLIQSVINHTSNATKSSGSKALDASSSSLVRRFSQSPQESKSMLMGGGSHASVMENAAEAQMHKIKSKMDAQDAAPMTPLRRVVRLLADSVALFTVGTLATSLYYYIRYDVADLEKIVSEVKTKEENQFPGSEFWVSSMEQYLGARKKLETKATLQKQPRGVADTVSMWKKNVDKVKEFTDPSHHSLLPDMDPALKGRIKTLVLDLNDVLVHKEWTRQKGWTLYKRPVFTDEPNTYADPIINKLDSMKMIPYRLYRPETQYSNGKHVRDLSKLNRDLSQVLFISSDPSAYAFQPENCVKLKPWLGEKSPMGDTTLLDLIPMLQLIATRGVTDVRDCIRSYDGEEDVAQAFKSRMQHVAQAQAPKPRSFLSGK